jgi:hypothetical protein
LPIKAGTSTFEFTRPIVCDGHLHLALYPEGSESWFGNVYFGTESQMKEITSWKDWEEKSAKPDSPSDGKAAAAAGSLPTANNVAKKELLLLLTPHIHRLGKTGAPKAEPPRVVEAPSVSSSPSAKEPLYSLHCDDMDARKVLELLIRQAHANIVVAPGVAGKITMDIHDKSLDEMLAIIAKLCNLTVRREGDVIFITTLAEIRKAQENSLPVRVYHLSYVKSSTVEKMIRPLISPKGRVTLAPDAEKSMLEKNGIGSIIIVQDYDDVLKTMDGVIAKIDVQRR